VCYVHAGTLQHCGVSRPGRIDGEEHVAGLWTQSSDEQLMLQGVSRFEPNLSPLSKSSLYRSSKHAPGFRIVFPGSKFRATNLSVERWGLGWIMLLLLVGRAFQLPTALPFLYCQLTEFGISCSGLASAEAYAHPLHAKFCLT
jgi:hypothetical protein